MSQNQISQSQGSPNQRSRKPISRAPSTFVSNAHHLKMLIHDMNNSLMVLGLTADRLETLANGNGLQAQQNDAIGHDVGKHHHTLRQNVSHLGAMLYELSDRILPLPALCADQSSDIDIVSHSDVFLDCKGLMQFFAEQKADWDLISLPETKIQMQIATFQGAVTIIPAYLVRIFQNLVYNACEAYRQSDRGDGACELTLTVKGDADSICFSFYDNGPGIADKTAGKIFQPFETSKGATHLPRGLGLVSAKALAQKMGGDMHLDKSITKGACFVLTLPRISSSQ